MRRVLLLIVLTAFAIHECEAQTWTVGVTVRSIHFKKKNKHTNERYNNWNPGISIGYTNKQNIKFETAVVLNSHKEMAWMNTIGYWDGTYGAEIGTSTGYKKQTGKDITLGYFVSYESHGIRVKGNHLMVNFGFNNTFDKIQTQWDAIGN